MEAVNSKGGRFSWKGSNSGVKMALVGAKTCSCLPLALTVDESRFKKGRECGQRWWELGVRIKDKSD